MISVSDKFRETMAQRRDFRCRAEVTLADGTELVFGEEELAVAGNRLTDGPAAQSLPLGAAVCRQVRLEIANNSGKLQGVDFFGAKVHLWLALPVDDGEERIELGTFTVTEPETWGGTVVVTAADGMYRADRPYETQLSFPATLESMFRDICDRCGIPYATAAFANSSFMVDAPPEGDYTCRQVLGFIAMLAGGNARLNRQGQMEILPYGLDREPVAELADWHSLKTATDDVTVTGLSAAVTETDEEGQTTERTVLFGREGYVLEIDNPLIAGKERQALERIGAGLVGVPFRPFEGEHAAFPMAEFMDTVRLRDREGNTVTSVLTDVTFAFGGATSFANRAAPAGRNASRYLSPESRARIAARKLVERERSARETAIRHLNERLAASGGLYTTAQVQPDGSTVYYLHDRPGLDESVSVMKLTAEAIGLSVDGGKTWPFGFSVTGEMVMGIIRAEGLSADWVQFGTLDQARVAGLPEMASQLEVLREGISAAVQRVETLSGQALTGAASEYYLSASPEMPAEGAWSETFPVWEPGTFIWVRQRVTRADGTDVYTQPYCLSQTISDTARDSAGELEAALAEQIEYVLRQTAGLTERADEISAVVSDVQQAVDTGAGEIQDLFGEVSQLRQTAGELALRFDSVEVDHVVTSSGYTFDANGLDISKQGEEMHNQLTNLGMYVRRNEDIILQADASGVEATDVQINNFLLLGRHARFEDYSDGTDSKRTACFFVG